MLKSEAGWSLGCYIEFAFECDASLAERAFVEQAADESDAVGNATRRGELRQGMGGVGSPIAAGFRDFDEASAESERRMAGVVGDDENFVAERGDEEQVDLGHDAGHLCLYQSHPVA